MIPRNQYLRKIEAGFTNNPIVVLTGARQVGKTTLMELFMLGKKCLWLNGQNPEIAQVFERFSTLERYLQLNINTQLAGWLAIDEFQYINKVSVMLKLLVDKYKKLNILCSGSSSLQILQEVEESLAGRVRIVPVYSLSFLEYVAFVDNDLGEKLLNCSIYDDVNTLLPKVPVLLDEYLVYGGLPKVVLARNTLEKQELLNDIYQTYLLRDVRQFIENKDVVAFNKLLRLLAAGIGQLLNINELSRTIRLPYKTCEEFLYVLEQMFIIRMVQPYYQNKRKEISKMNKLYFCDNGLRNVVFNSFNGMDYRLDNGALFENYVYLQLLQYIRPDQVCFYRTKDGTEIDFVMQGQGETVIPVEVKYKSVIRYAKIRAITEFRKSAVFDQAYVVNLTLSQSQENLHYVQPYILNNL